MSTRSVVCQSVSVPNVLDLTNPVVRSQLGITLEQITGDDNFLTQSLGDFARGRYSGILALSARQAGTSNLILFQELKP